MAAEAAPTCACCGGPRWRPAYAAVGHRFERCLDCGFVRMADPPDDGAVDAQYVEDEAHGLLAFQEQAQDLPRFDEMLRRVEAVVPPGRLLDVGCSIGTSLEAARARGWDAVGLELSRPVAEWARRERGLDVRPVRLEEAGFAPGSFDAVLMHHTLEHLARPDEVVARCRALLRSGGAMYQALPDHASLKGLLFGEHWTYGVVPQHLSHFTRRTLGMLLRRAGLRVVRTWTRTASRDPHLLISAMARLGRMDLLLRWCGTPAGFDQEAYVRLMTDRPWARMVSQRLWPAALVRWLGLGEDLHVLAVRDGTLE
ncbi:MAG: class I SAM-dependent methyltransferase [Planctomycetota bacterium]